MDEKHPLVHAHAFADAVIGHAVRLPEVEAQIFNDHAAAVRNFARRYIRSKGAHCPSRAKHDICATKEQSGRHAESAPIRYSGADGSKKAVETRGNDPSDESESQNLSQPQRKNFEIRPFRWIAESKRRCRICRSGFRRGYFDDDGSAHQGRA